MNRPAHATSDLDATARLAALVERAERIACDLELASVRDWKARHPGRAAIGYLPVYVPREILHAARALPVGIVGGGDRIEIIKGDACFQSYVCHLPRSVVELGLSGRLDPLDGMLFPSVCDVLRNLSGIWKLLFPGKFVRYVDLPQNFDPAIGGAWWREELARLFEDVAALSNAPADEATLRESIGIHDENRALLDALDLLRRKEPWKTPTSEVYLVQRAGLVLPIEEHNTLLREYLELARASARPPLDNARVAVVGAFCEQPPLDLIKTLERAGCYVVHDDFMLGARFLRGPIEAKGDPLAALALAWLTQSVAHASVWSRDRAKGQELVEHVRACGAEGVLFAAPSFCDPALLDQPMLQARLDAERIPHTSFKYSENTGQFQGIREQAGTFADAIKLWSEA